MSIADARERAEALDVTRSFCVTAPAGSGKTELLIQRLLGLLGRVQRPEQVLAITFTRKAAAEMRERVLQALEAAQVGAPVEGEHQQVTRDLALAALQRSDAEHWQLSRDISRLNIKTIDSFCAGLTRQMPILSRFGGQAQAVDDAVPLYREAVAELFSLVGSRRPEAADLDQLLLHFDNNWDRLSDLLVTMLGKRDQWHDYMGARRSPDEAEQALRHTVESVVAETLRDVLSVLDPWQDELLDLFCYARQNLGESVPEEFPSTSADDLELWRSLGQMLLTQGGSLRKSITVNNGFPTGSDEARERKQHFGDLVARMSEVPGLATELAALAWLPRMDNHSQAWQLVLHLSHVLPLLAACLLLVFERRGVVDHSQVALSALDALGEDDSPTELAMRLDYSIEHILVDEFQDTAINQYRLVTRLTRGWAEHNANDPQNPRTVFIVGDGMQSIYGFRNANVGLFLKAREEGFNGLLPETLALRCNFRSEQGVVDWVNATFSIAFPSEDNVRRGRVSFTDAVAIKGPAAEPAVSLNAFWGEHAREQEAHWLLTQISEGLGDPEIRSMAILGRSRGQLAPILQLLRQQGVPFASQDMDALAGSPAIVDLMTLCRVLVNPADRVAGYALLRAPWCALSLADLGVVSAAAGEPRYQNIAKLLCSGELPAGLSEDGATRLSRVGQCLRWAEQKRDRLSLRVWVEQLWQHLGGPGCLREPRFLADAERFLSLLQEAEAEGVGLDAQWLEHRIARLYASGDDPDARLQVMTLHKSKGLEFDWVLIPALAQATRGDGRDLLLWDEYNSSEGERGFLLAADDHSDDKSPGLYNFLKKQRREKSRLETTRLLYVGATRAIKRLTLSACLGGGEDCADGEQPRLRPPGEGALLAPIWPLFEQQMRLHARAIPEPQQPAASGGLMRLQSLPASPVLASSQEAAADANIPAPALNWLDRYVGTVIHELLETLSLQQDLPETLPAGMAEHGQQRLAALGLDGEALVAGSQRVVDAVTATLGDERWGRWLLSSTHLQAHSELALTMNDGDTPRDIVIDRTFVDARTGVRWVVDYKSSVPADGVVTAYFLSTEGERYREQLAYYRQAAETLGPQPVQCALYFTALGLFYPLDDPP
ncbi:DNA helicase UvrD [Seongchinamella unica]|uniref:DNA 3'-5' helicase n=1 Tax=Seongchinamella unica TaxID=2547392 RepID=A0A4R5LSA2_9GAMM|nr:UvrD-helicase domain-containing protein [Seongchinamella unica]TDG13771.1 DNA helicase UvrD [Seongchinamella unica]